MGREGEGGGGFTLDNDSLGGDIPNNQPTEKRDKSNLW